MSDQTPEQTVHDQIAAGLGPQDTSGGTSDDLGAQVAAAGGGAQEVDPVELLRQIQQLQARLDAADAEKKAESVPEIVDKAQALAGHLQVKADTNPAIAASQHNYDPGLELAGRLVDAAKSVQDDPSAARTVSHVAGQIGTWLARIDRRHASQDYSYLIDLAEDVADLADRAAA